MPDDARWAAAPFEHPAGRCMPADALCQHAGGLAAESPIEIPVERAVGGISQIVRRQRRTRMPRGEGRPRISLAKRQPAKPHRIGQLETVGSPQHLQRVLLHAHRSSSGGACSAGSASAASTAARVGSGLISRAAGSACASCFGRSASVGVSIRRPVKRFAVSASSDMVSHRVYPRNHPFRRKTTGTMARRNESMAHHIFISVFGRRQALEKWRGCGGSIKSISVERDPFREKQLLLALFLVLRRLSPQDPSAPPKRRFCTPPALPLLVFWSL